MRRPRLSGWRRWLLLYGVLLAASHVVRWTRDDPPPPAEGLRSVELAARDAEGRALDAPRVRTAYADLGQIGGDALPVVLLHGSPSRGRDLAALGEALAADRRVLVPHLPGFGASERALPDYSVGAHAGYVLELLDALGVERAHVLGFSMGGGVGIELAHRAPARVASLVLVSAIGVQELELFGDYHLNHALHGLQLGLLWGLEELVPHFGALDGGMLSVEYARNFFDTDQRPLRARLAAWEGPTFILHGRDDVLVPFDAAREHARLVPQSELRAYEGNHFLVFRAPERLAADLGPFLRGADAGRAPSRAQASPERVRAAAAPFDPAGGEPLRGLAQVLFLVLAALGTLVSEDLACIAVGALVGQGRLEFLPGAIACFLGIYVGDLLLYVAGRWLGRPALARWPLASLLSPARLERAARWFERRGPAVVFLSRFTPGMRLPTYFTAGVLRMGVLRFSLWFFLAAALWTPALVYAASRIGSALTERLELFQRNFALGLAGTVLVGLVLVKGVRPLCSWRGRRLAAGRWRRLVRWEYWPAWALYPPVVLGCLWHGLRRRRPLAFTAVNPCMPHGGFVGESKGAILRGLSGRPERVARTLTLAAEVPAADARRAVEPFAAGLDAPWPLVVKPDAGQRGEGVHVVRSWGELAAAVQRLAGDVLVQEYLPGPEFGLFYARHPDEPRGTLRSITRKVLPAVVGDGERTLERLVLEDERARCMAERFLASRPDADVTVPAAGERVRLGELGTHCLGAAFLDGRELVTPALLEAVDDLARSYDGFHFGRFDVRAESEEALRAGRFRVLELNGVTSEEAHVYDPRYPVGYAWRTLLDQWRTATDIGLANARRGARVSTARELLAAWRAYRRTVRARRPEGPSSAASPSAAATRAGRPEVMRGA